MHKRKGSLRKVPDYGPGRHEIVDQQKYGKKTKYKNYTIKYHNVNSLYHG